MPLNKLENFIKNTEGRILYVNPNDLDATDAITNQGNSLTKPFKTVQRALLESARFSYLRGNDNDITEKTTILLFPGEYIIDNRPGYAIKTVSGQARAVAPSGEETAAIDSLSLTLNSNFDLTQEDNILYKFNSINGGVVVPRGTSIVGLDLRKTKIRAKYVPNPTDPNVGQTAIFRITGACYFWQLSFFDADESGVVYTDDTDFSSNNQSKPTFSHHKLTCFEYADGVNIPSGYQITDLDMYYSKLSNAFNLESGRNIDQKYPSESLGFAKQRPEWEIVGAFANDPIVISSIKSGDGFVPSVVVTVTTATEHNLTSGTPIKIRGVAVEDYNISTKVQNVISETEFTYLLSAFRDNLPASPASATTQTVTVETDTVSGASPYVFNISLRSVWGMNGMHADGSKASGFRSMVVAQFTGVSLQKDDRAFVKYDPTSRVYDGITISRQTGSNLSKDSSALNPDKVYHLDSNAVYRRGWEPIHIKISNDAFIQVVSVFAIGFNRHFDVQSGGDASITNSNSNFGQISLVAEGFKKQAFEKDNNAYITSIVAPKAVTRSDIDVDWISLDVQKTINVGISSHLYLFGFTAQDDVPPVIIQGYRIGARRDEKLYVNTVGATIKDASICMIDSFAGGGGNVAKGAAISEKEYFVSSGPTNNTLTLSTVHGLQNGEKIRIISENGDLPENIEPHIVYYAITTGLASNQIRIAASKTNADAEISINIYGGVSLKILSRVSDKTSGELGFPIQYDNVNSQWYIHSTFNNNIYTEIVAQGVGVLGERTNVTYVKRIEDPRSLEDKLYKFRVVIPQTSINARDPLNSFIIQESSSTGIGSDGYSSNLTITSSDFNYGKNPRFISTCSIVGTALSAVAERPHNLNVNDIIIIKNVSSSTNTNAQDNLGYNGTFRVTEIVNDKVFKYGSQFTDVFGIVHVPGTFTGITTIRNTNLPRFERNDAQNNYYIYRNDALIPYIFGVQDGVYQITALNFENAIPTEFTDFKYSQNIVDLYPQLDKDNLVENPRAASSFAKRNPIGDVITNELQRSITRETIDSFVPTFGAGLKITGVSTSFSSTTLGTVTLTFDRDHGLNGISTYTSLTGGSGKTNGTYYGVKLFNNTGLTDWRGATAKVIVSGGSVASAEIMSGGSGYNGSNTLYFDTNIIGGAVNASMSVDNTGISSCLGDVIQVTGLGNTSDGYYRISSVPSRTQVAFAITNFDPKPLVNQYAFNNGPSVQIQSTPVHNSDVGISTFTTNLPHGLLAGNRFRVVTSTGSNLGDFLVKEKISNTSFSAITNNSLSSGAFILKHAFSSNDAVSDKTDENISVRNTHFYDNQILRLDQNITNDTSFQVSLLNSQIGVMPRFPLGSYILVDSEIMRVSRNGLTGAGSNRLNVIRGVFGTRTQDHTSGSLIRKIKVLPIEFRRPSISRASGHTFEYLGYGPGNYSTGLPQLQVKTITEREDYLSQAQERSGGTVVYTGMNSDGDFFIGNTKYSSSSGTQKTFDIPVPTVTAEDPSRTSVIFDELRVKERLLVEGGNSSTVLSQFDGPVTFNNETKINDTTTINAQLKVLNQNQSSNKDTGAVVIEGGLGVEKNTNIGGNSSISGTLQVLNQNQSSDKDTGAVVIEGGLGVEKNVNIGGNSRISGILTVTGNVYVGGPDAGPNFIAFRGTTGDNPGGYDHTYIGERIWEASEKSELVLFKGNDTTGPGPDRIRFIGNEIRFDTYTSATSGTFEQVSTSPNVTTKVTIDQNGNVGLGIVSPGQKLDVRGVGQFVNAGNQLLLHTGTNVPTVILRNDGLDYYTLLSNPGITPSGTWNTLRPLYINLTTGLLVSNNGQSFSGGTSIFGNLSVSGNTSIGSNLTVSGTASFGSNVSISGQLTVASSGSALNVDNNLNVTGIATVSALNISTSGMTDGDLGSDGGSDGIFGIFNTTNNGITQFLNKNASGVYNDILSLSHTQATIDGELSLSKSITLNGTSAFADANIYSTGGADGSFILFNTTNSGTTSFYNKDASGVYNDILSLSHTQVTVDGELRVTGDIIAFYTPSDKNWKDNIAPIPDALNKVISISGNTFDWNEKSNQQGHDVGVIAQEVLNVLPEAVTQREDGHLSVSYQKLVPLLVEAIKELSQKVENLENKLNNK